MRRHEVREAVGPLRGTVGLPGDKSIAHRALMFNAAARGRATVSGLPSGRDVASTLAAMETLGARVERVGPGVVEVTGRDLLLEAGRIIDCGNSGTTMRLLCGLLAGQGAQGGGAGLETTLVGDGSLSRRPMRRVAEPLAGLGAEVRTTDGHAPLHIRGRLLSGAEVPLAVASAQVKSAVLLAGLQARGTTTVIEPTPTRNHTELLLAAMGADLGVAPAVAGGAAVSVRGPGRLQCVDVSVPGDPSSAAFLVVAAVLVPGSDLTIEGVLLNPTRLGFLQVLRRMGADVESRVEAEVGGEQVGTLRARHSRLHAFEVAAQEVPATVDELPLLAVAAAFAEGVSRVRGAGELRVKESDRIASTAALLAALGVEVEVFDDGFDVAGGCPRGGAMIATHADHRIAMAAAVAALACADGIVLDDVDPVAVSFPEFFQVLARIGA